VTHSISRRRSPAALRRAQERAALDDIGQAVRARLEDPAHACPVARLLEDVPLDIPTGLVEREGPDASHFSADFQPELVVAMRHGQVPVEGHLRSVRLEIGRRFNREVALKVQPWTDLETRRSHDRRGIEGLSAKTDVDVDALRRVVDLLDSGLARRSNAPFDLTRKVVDLRRELEAIIRSRTRREAPAPLAIPDAPSPRVPRPQARTGPALDPLQVRLSNALHPRDAARLGPRLVETSADVAAIAARAATFVPRAEAQGDHVIVDEGPPLRVALTPLPDGERSRPPRVGSTTILLAEGLDAHEAEVEIARCLSHARSTRRGDEPTHKAQQVVASVRISQYFTADQFPGGRERARAAVESALADAGLACATPEALRSFLGTVGAERLEKLRYLEGPDYAPLGRQGGPGVKLWGTSTCLVTKDVLTARPGHIMATVPSAAGGVAAHFSYGPAGRDPVRFDTPAQGPFRGAVRLSNFVQRGQLFGHAEDPYIGPKVDFGHRFDPAFIDPEAVTRLVHNHRSLVDGDPYSNDYVLATEASAGDGTPARRASNCATTLMSLLGSCAGPDGRPLLRTIDFLVLGLRPDGVAEPGGDVRPQDLFEHLRFLEARFLSRES